MNIDPEKVALRNALIKHGGIVVEAAPGTGKTYAGVYLAREAFRNGWTNKYKNTLFMTFSRNARVQIEDEMDNFRKDDKLSKEEANSIQVSNYHSFYYECLHKRRGYWGINKLRPATRIESEARDGNQGNIIEGIKQGKPRYDDFAPMFFALMKYNQSFLEWLRIRFPFLILDEYQDTDAIQWKILNLWKPKHIAIFYDRFQMIYGFRNASLDNVQNVIKEYSIPSEAQLSLSKIYRLADGNTLHDFIFTLRSDCLLGNDVPRSEYRPWLTMKVSALTHRKSIPIRCATQIRYLSKYIDAKESTAIITRSNNLAASLQKCLSRKSTGVVKWYTCCKLMSGDEDADEELRIMISTLRNSNNAKQIRKWFGELFDRLLINPIKLSGKDVIFTSQFRSKEHMLANKRDPILRDMRNDYCAMFDSIDKGNYEIICRLFDYILKYSFMLTKSKSTLDPDWLYYIRAFSKATKTCHSDMTWEEYCNKLETTLLIAGHCRHHMTSGVTILNAHQSKGRQFDHVILAWLSQSGENPFKGDRPCYDYNDGQERQLLYVAMTRAKKKVTIIYPEESPSEILYRWKLL